MLQTRIFFHLSLISVIILLWGNVCTAQELNFGKLTLKEYSYNSIALKVNNTITKKTVSVSTFFFAGVGPLLSFSTSERQQNYATFYLNIGIDFKLSGWFYMNAGSGFFYEKSSNSIVLTLNLVPQFKLGNDRMEFYFGFGGLLAINGGPRKGAGYGLLPQLKFNYFFNDKLGIGAEISHPTTFEYFPEFFINVSFCFISRL